jgi:magnesium chelatase subunit D
MSDPLAPASIWERANLAAALFALDPLLGGIVLRGAVGPAQEAWFAALRDLLPAGVPMRRLPPGIGDDALTGGLDLAATLRAGRSIAGRGILAQASGGVLVLAMAERLPPATAARIVAAMDRGDVSEERAGSTAGFGIIAIDEGQDEDERPPAALTDRLAFSLDLSEVGWRVAVGRFWGKAQISNARTRLASVRNDATVIEALVTLAANLGVRSLRPPLHALRAARAFAALRGSDEVEEADIVAAAQLVLAPRATTFPSVESPPDSRDTADAEAESREHASGEGAEPPADPSLEELRRAELNDLVLSAAAAAIPPGLLALIAAGEGRAKSGRERTRAAKSVPARRGRPTAARRGALREGRLSLVDTLRAAAPWQVSRRREGRERDAQRFIVRPEDFRIVRFRARSEQTAVFVVDASGSSAAQRLAEVKGAIELLLVDCYVRRDSVALVAFRGVSGEVILPPTRSLARAKRTLSGLPGGGGTPLASGLDVALGLADSLRRKGRVPLLVLMTDGRANIARDGTPGRARALEDALDAATRIRAMEIAALAIDTSPYSRTETEPPTLRLGRAMNARYIKLPNADAARVSETVLAASRGY